MARLYNGKTWDEMNAIYTKQYRDTTPEEREYLAGLTKEDYDAYVMEKNWATADPGSNYTGWNGGSVTSEDWFQAVQDSLKYGYDIQLDPRSNAGASQAIGNTLLDANEKANADAIAGIGDYETNRQNYLDQIGWTDYNSVFQSLQNTGTLGLKDLEGNAIESSFELGNPNFVFTPTGAAGDRVNLHPTTPEQDAPQSAVPQTTPQTTVPQTTVPQTTVPQTTPQATVQQIPVYEPYEPSETLNILQKIAEAQNQNAGYQSEYLQQLQQMMPTMPEAYQSQYAQQLQQAPTMPEAYQSQYAQQLQQMPTLQTPEQSQYYEQMMQALNVPQANAPDLSGLEALLNLPEGYEVAPYEGNLNALLQTPEQQAAYTQQLQALQEQYKMPEATPFTYDPATDPIYQAYLQQYTRDANQGMRDTLGQISARTGGLASSYAGQAAQQTYNEYMKQAADILPAMNEAAYNRWLNEQQMARSENADAYNRALQMLDRQTAADQTAWEQQAFVEQQNYQRYLDELTRQMQAQQAEWERQAMVEGESYNRQQNAYNQQLAANQLAFDRLAQLDAQEYARQLDAINLQNAYEKEAYNRALTQEQLAYQQYLNNVDLQRATEQEAYNRALTQEQLAYQQYLNNVDLQRATEQEAYDRALTQEQLAYQQYLNNVDLQRATEQEAYDRALTQEQLAYQQYLNDVNLRQQTEQEAYNRALTQEQLAYQQYLNNVDLQRATEQEAYDRALTQEQLAYQQYLNNAEMQRATEQETFDRLAQLENFNYGMYQDELQRQLNAEQTAWERQAYLDELNYARQQDAIDRQTAADQTAWERQIYQQQMAADQQTQNANLLLSLMESYGYQPTAQELAAAGLSQGMANAVGNAYQNQLNMQWANINNKTNSGGTGDVPQATDYLNVLQSAGVKDAGTATFMLVNAGMKVSDAETLASYYMDVLDEQNQQQNSGNSAALPEAVYNEAVLRINDYLYSGTVNQAQQAMNYVERIWDQLNANERKNIVAMFAAAGYNLQG